MSEIFIVGPTASGKSQLAMQLAKEFGGEIVCADSQTIRKGMSIGTAKPSHKDRLEVPHHLLDVIGPYEEFSVHQFKQLASKSIKDIHSRGAIPIVVGGSGLYVDALYYDFDVENEEKSSEYKSELNAKSVEELQKIIQENGYKMPNNPQNPRHLIGTILRRGKVKSNQNPRESTLILGLKNSDEELKNRIAARVDIMFENGLSEEVEQLTATYGTLPPQIDAIGYSIVVQYLAGQINLAQAKEQFARAHWQYARRQKAWFKRNTHISWFEHIDEAVLYLKKVL